MTFMQWMLYDKEMNDIYAMNAVWKGNEWHFLHMTIEKSVLRSIQK